MKEKLIILGAGVMQGPAIKIAKELGFYAVALDGSKEAPCVSLADQFEQIDLKDKEGIEAFARSLQNTGCRVGIMTAGTDFSASVAWAAEKLGLPGIPYEAALNASDKSRMRECFKKANLPSPNFTTITASDLPLTPNSLLPTPQGGSAAAPLNFPLVIKPVDNMGSRGCRRVDTAEELNEAAKTAIGFSRSGRAIVESYMEGPEFSVDAVVYHGEITICGLADRHIFFPPYFIEMGHTMPTVIEEEKQQAMLDTFRAGIHALGIAGAEYIGAAKGDIKLTANGPMIGEIAARLSGGYMSGWTYPYSSGALPIKGAILAAMGRKPEGLIPVKEWTCAERAFISIPGTVKEIYGLEQARETPNVNDLFLRITEGGKVSFPENNVTKCGNILAAAPERAAAAKAAETAARSILIKLDPSDPETKEFILNFPLAEAQRRRGEERGFPPDAFILPDEIKAAFYQLPDSLFPTPHDNNTLSNNNSLFPLPSSLLPTPQKSNTPSNNNPAPPRPRASARGLFRTNPPQENLFLHPFPAFTSSNLKDYMGRSIEENMDAVRKLTGFSLPNAPENADNIVILGRSFWAAFIRGAYQGAAYYIGNLGAKWQKNTSA